MRFLSVPRTKEREIDSVYSMKREQWRADRRYCVEKKNRKKKSGRIGDLSGVQHPFGSQMARLHHKPHITTKDEPICTLTSCLIENGNGNSEAIFRAFTSNH